MGHKTATGSDPAGGGRPAKGFTRFQEQVSASMDPLGVVMPLLHAQAGWMLHPQELAERWGAFLNDASLLTAHAWMRFCGAATEEVIKPQPDDSRFADPVWVEQPGWSALKQWYLLLTRHAQDMLYDTPGLPPTERRRAAFWWRQWLNAVAPTNSLLTNPVARRKALETGGQSLVDGWRNFLDDMRARDVRLTNPDDFEVGGNLALTPGSVVRRTPVVEIIHYAPTRSEVHATPIVIVTPWINKFYILDLTPKKSLVRFLLDAGFDVYITSWKNPGAEMRDTRFDDYVTEGIAVAVDTARALSGSAQVHAVGYCIGGTALSVYMAWAARRYGQDAMPVAHWTLFTTLVDFSNPGDIEVFIDEGSVRYLCHAINTKGYLDGREMATSFRLLRSNPLIWQYVVQGWLLGQKPASFDVLYWNMDATRMPAAMHTWYLRELYLHNRLVHPDALEIAGERIDLSRIDQPLYAVAAEDDHIAPWRQTFRIMNFVRAEKRFVLSSSGHILGIVNPPVTPPKREYWVADAHRPDTAGHWRERADRRAGSWWDDWQQWLHDRCGPKRPAPAVESADFPALADAPGVYVLER